MKSEKQPSVRSIVTESQEEYWKSSDVYKAGRRGNIIASVLLWVGIIGVVAAIIGYDNTLQSKQLQQVFVSIGAFSLLLVLFCGPLWSGLNEKQKREVLEQFQFDLLSQVREEERDLTGNAVDEQSEYSALWNSNRGRLDIYHQIATDQAKRAFAASQRAIGVGLGLVIGLSIAATLVQSEVSTIVLGSIAAVSAAVSGYIASTYLKAQAEASAQLRIFFVQPVDEARILSAERLLNHLSLEHKPDAVARIIDSVMKPNAADGVPAPRAKAELASTSPVRSELSEPAKKTRWWRSSSPSRAR